MCRVYNQEFAILHLGDKTAFVSRLIPKGGQHVAVTCCRSGGTMMQVTHLHNDLFVILFCWWEGENSLHACNADNLDELLQAMKLQLITHPESEG